MYLNILKNDLKNKRAMNIILLLFIVLATVFVSSGINNILCVTSALNTYLDKADVPDCFFLTMNKSTNTDLISEYVAAASDITRYDTERLLFLDTKDIVIENGNSASFSGTNMLQGDSDLAINYFKDDGTILQSINEGEIYVTYGKEKKMGLTVGEKITVSVDDITKVFTFAGSVRDASLGSSTSGMCRFIINNNDFKEFYRTEVVNKYYGGTLHYIHTDNLPEVMKALSPVSDDFLFLVDKEDIKSTYIFDMIVTGILILVGAILIAIAFVVLRFTISLTISQSFREIGVMKAIGISNIKIRGLYLIKYFALSVFGTLFGFILSIPFSKLLIDASGSTIMLPKNGMIHVNLICSLCVVALIILFCFGCTAKINKITPIDAVRNGENGQRFSKKGIISLSSYPLGTRSFLAFNDILSNPKRYALTVLVFLLCLCILLILSISVTTMESPDLLNTFALSHGDIFITMPMKPIMKENGRDVLSKRLKDMENTLQENGMTARCSQEILFTLTAEYNGKSINCPVFQGMGTTMDMYDYTLGTAPQSVDEMAITRRLAEDLNVSIGDTVTVKLQNGDIQCIVTAFFQTMSNQGKAIRLHTDVDINYISAHGSVSTQIAFADSPTEKQVNERVQTVKTLFPNADNVQSARDFIVDALGITDVLNSIKSLVTVLTIALTALITVLIEHSFITNEKGEIALLKAVGFKNISIYAHLTLRFLIVGLCAVLAGWAMMIPLTHLCVDPIFKMMGMELNVNYTSSPAEVYIIFPLVIILTTSVCAFLTSLVTKNIKPTDTANIE